MSFAINKSLILETEECCNCGVVFAMPRSMRARLLADGGSFFCPNGHSQHYTKPRVKQLEEQLAETERQMRAAKCAALNKQAALEKLQKESRRISRRVHAGVCPCCNRSFQNLARHMKTKHAEAAQ